MTAPRIRTLSRAEAAEAVEWAAREGWNPGLADLDAFLAQDAGAFRGLFHDGALAVTLSAARYAGGFAFVGFYICRPELRGRGLGLALWQETCAGLDGTVGLDGVVAQQANYARSGFGLAHRNIRYGGRPAGADDDPRVVPVDARLRPAVEALDLAAFGYARPDFLARWLDPPGGRALAFVQDGAVRGYGVVRPCREGFKIGPLFADDAAVATALFGALAAAAGDGPVFLDVPEPNAAARALAEAAGLAPVFETARMYRGLAPELPLPRIFGITTFELG